jgi:Effector Associated Constant Component 1
VDIAVALTSPTSGDEVRSLRQWLVADDELRGRVRVVEKAPEPGTLGALADALVVTLGPSGAATAFAGALITWIRHRKSDLVCRVTRPDGLVAEVSAQQVRELDAAAIRALVEDLSKSFNDSGEETQSGNASQTGR